MSNRQTIIGLIPTLPVEIQKSLQEKLEIHQDDEDAMADWPDYDLADAFHDFIDCTESAILHGDGSDARQGRKALRSLQDLMIRAGYYKKRTERVYTLGRDPAIKRDGEKYDCEESWEEWIEK